MHEAYIFTPKSENDKRKNLEDFMSFVENNFPPINDVDYTSPYWKGMCNFTKFGTSSKTRNSDMLLHSSLMRFAKAYITYSQTLRRTRNVVEIYAFRALDKCMEGCSDKIDITTFKAADFERAVQSSRQHLAHAVAYATGRMLLNLHNFLIEKGIIDKSPWRNPLSKDSYCSTASDEADKLRNEKMPDENALLALATISSKSSETLSARDVFTTSAIALLLSAPERASELFYLKIDCLHKEKMTIKRALECGFKRDELKNIMGFRVKFSDKPDGVELSDTISNAQFSGEPNLKDDDIIELVGIKWFSGKGYGYANKWIPTVMIPAVERAVERLKEQSALARAFATLLEESTDFPRHPLCPDVSEDTLLTQKEVVAALGFDISGQSLKQAYTSVIQLLKRKGIERKDYVITLRGLNTIVRNDLGKSFPYIYFPRVMHNIQVRWSESLFAGFSNSYASYKGVIGTELLIPTINMLNTDMGSFYKNVKVTERSHPSKTIFERWGFGQLSLSSHQMRHMLDTMALVNGMSEMARAKWAQRADSRQNKYYDHMTPDEYGEDFAQSQEVDIVVPPSVVKVIISTPKTIQELNTKASLTAHTTEFGMCLSSYLSDPCGKHRDCVNCNEHILQKGDAIKCNRLRFKLKMEERLLIKDQKAVDNAVPGASRWLARRILTVDRCKELIRLLSDPDIEDGALIKLEIQDYSLIDRSLIANNKKVLPRVINYLRMNNLIRQDLAGTEIIDVDAVVSEKAELTHKEHFGEEDGKTH
ncbi:hypothetical protein [Buttiauxella gaviniae]|uniref:hypothetical protein n=1 Tax=Buttiauxella gaviniae TaxID=82990 RepID=UPI003975B82D